MTEQFGKFICSFNNAGEILVQFISQYCDLRPKSSLLWNLILPLNKNNGFAKFDIAIAYAYISTVMIQT